MLFLVYFIALDPKGNYPPVNVKTDRKIKFKGRRLNFFQKVRFIISLRVLAYLSGFLVAKRHFRIKSRDFEPRITQNR